MSDTIYEIRKTGNLFYLLNAFLGAYNRRTDVMERAVKLDERVQAVIHKLNTAGENLKQAVDNNQPEGE
jgi:hypothetical protein